MTEACVMRAAQGWRRSSRAVQWGKLLWPTAGASPLWIAAIQFLPRRTRLPHRHRLARPSAGRDRPIVPQLPLIPSPHRTEVLLRA